MKNLYITVSFCLSFVLSFGQTNISGTINTYTAVSTITNSGCTTCNNPACYDDITVSSSAGFTAGGRALIIQMKGTVIDESNSVSFGNITNYNNTGNYEFARIISIPNGTTVRVAPLTKVYRTSLSTPRGVTQLVNVPVYAGDVNVSGTLTATAWNGTTGGVLSFIAVGKVTLSANIDVSGKGFRGFPHHELSNGDCTEQDFYMSSTTEPNQGAWKGEGVAIVIPNKELGRGKQANGGGGGIGHNGGGGGGGNGGTGGYGGQMYSGCPNLYGRGEGGLGLAGTSISIFMGGGGGTGDSNGTGALDPGGDGTNGGGIVIIEADSIVNTTNLTGYTGAAGPAYQAGGYFSSTYTHLQEFNALCQLTLNSVTVNAQAAQTVTIQLRAPDKTTVLQTVSVAVPAGISAVPVGFSIAPARGYFLVASGTGSLYFKGNTGAYPYTVADVISVTRCEPNPGNNNIPYMYDWNVTARCASGGYKIDASGIDNPFAITADGGGGGGAGGSIYIAANGYRGIIPMIAKGGEGAEMLDGGCHAPGGGGAGGVICTKTVPPVGVYRNVTGAAPGEIPDSKSSCWTPPVTGYNSHGATKGTDGLLCTNLIIPGCPPLPVEFISFTGWNDGDINFLKWSTASEINNNYFRVERSLDGVNFQTIGQVKGNGNSNSILNYQFIDENIPSGILYYRLTQVDYDGTHKTSDIISIHNEKSTVSLFPNPFNNETYLVVSSDSDYNVTVRITDLSGKNLYSSEYSTNERITLGEDFPEGIYIVEILSEYETKTVKVIKIRH